MSTEFSTAKGRIDQAFNDEGKQATLDFIKSPQPPSLQEIKTPKLTWVKVDLNSSIDDSRLKIEFPFASTTIQGRACDGFDYAKEGFILNNGIWCFPKEPRPSGNRPLTLPSKEKTRLLSKEPASDSPDKSKSAFAKLFTRWFK
jgi:hypothetical protein